MLHLNIVINITVTILSALAAFLQYHYLTDTFPLLTIEITNATNISIFFSALSLSLPFVIAHLVSSQNFHKDAMNEALTIKSFYNKLIFGALTLIFSIALVLAWAGKAQFALLLVLFSANILLKNLLYSALAFQNGLGHVLSENIIKLIASVASVLSVVLLSKYKVWLPSTIQLLTLVSLIIVNHKLLGNQIPHLRSKAKISDLSADTLRSIRNHFLTSIPGFFIFNLNILIANIHLPAGDLKALTKSLYVVQGFATVVAASVRIIARNFNRFYLNKELEILQTSVNFYFKVTLVFLPLVLIIYNLYAPLALQSYFAFSDYTDPIIVYIFISFICIECYQVALTGLSYAAGKTEYHRVTWASAIISIALNLILSPLFGINGSLLAVAISQQITCNTFNFIRFKNEFKLLLFFTKDGLRTLLVVPLFIVTFALKPSSQWDFYIYIGIATIMLFIITLNNLKKMQKVDSQ